MALRTFMVLSFLLLAPCVPGRRIGSLTRRRKTCPQKTYYFQFGFGSNSIAVQLQKLPHGFPLSPETLLKVYPDMQWQAKAPEVPGLWEAPTATADWNKRWPTYWDPERKNKGCEDDSRIPGKGIYLWTLKNATGLRTVHEVAAVEPLTIPLSQILELSTEADASGDRKITIKYSVPEGAPKTLMLASGMYLDRAEYYPEQVLQKLCLSISASNYYHKHLAKPFEDPIPLDSFDAILVKLYFESMAVLARRAGLVGSAFDAVARPPAMGQLSMNITAQHGLGADKLLEMLALYGEADEERRRVMSIAQVSPKADDQSQQEPKKKTGCQKRREKKESRPQEYHGKERGSRPPDTQSQSSQSEPPPSGSGAQQNPF